MILICPECATRYRLADGAVGPAGRTVRCKACGHRWHATPESVAAAEAAAARSDSAAAVAEAAAARSDRAAAAAPSAARAEPPVERLEPIEAAPVPPPLGHSSGAVGGTGGAIAWLLLVLLILLVAALYIGRNQVVEAIPSLAPIYQKIGLRVAMRSGLELRNLSSSRTMENGRPVLVVSGEVHNTSAQERTLPRIRVALLDDARGEIEFGLFDAAERQLAAGATTKFEAKLLDPPEAAKTYGVSLADGL